MKTRILKTSIYKDETMLSMTPDVRFICVYLYTNDHISLNDVYKIPVQLVQLETGYDISTIKIALDKLQIAKVIKHHNHLWVRLLRTDFASLEYRGEKNDIALSRYVNEIPQDVIDALYDDTSIDTSMHTPPIVAINHKSEIINHKSKIINQKSSNRFDDFWAVYPKRELKKKAREIWESKNLDLVSDEIIDFVNRAKETDRWKRGYIKQPTTFLNNECWSDDIETYNDSRQKLEVLDLRTK